jgi:hypothetical protein
MGKIIETGEEWEVVPQPIVMPEEAPIEEPAIEEPVHQEVTVR